MYTYTHMHTYVLLVIGWDFSFSTVLEVTGLFNKQLIWNCGYSLAKTVFSCHIQENPPWMTSLVGKVVGRAGGHPRGSILLCTKCILDKVWWSGLRGWSSMTPVSQEKFDCTVHITLLVVYVQPAHGITQHVRSTFFYMYRKATWSSPDCFRNGFKSENVQLVYVQIWNKIKLVVNPLDASPQGHYVRRTLTKRVILYYLLSNQLFFVRSSGLKHVSFE